MGLNFGQIGVTGYGDNYSKRDLFRVSVKWDAVMKSSQK